MSECGSEQKKECTLIKPQEREEHVTANTDFNNEDLSSLMLKLCVFLRSKKYTLKKL